MGVVIAGIVAMTGCAHDHVGGFEHVLFGIVDVEFIGDEVGVLPALGL